MARIGEDLDRQEHRRSEDQAAATASPRRCGRTVPAPRARRELWISERDAFVAAHGAFVSLAERAR